MNSNHNQRKKDNDEAHNVTLSGATKLKQRQTTNREQMSVDADNHVVERKCLPIRTGTDLSFIIKMKNKMKKITLEEKYKTCLGLKQYDRAKKYLLQIKEKEIAIARIKQMPDNIKVSIG